MKNEAFLSFIRLQSLAVFVSAFNFISHSQGSFIWGVVGNEADNRPSTLHSNLKRLIKQARSRKLGTHWDPIAHFYGIKFNLHCHFLHSPENFLAKGSDSFFCGMVN